MANHLGSCLCGIVNFEIQGDFDSFYLCHCHYCQKDTGTFHAANLFSHSATLVWRSGEKAVTSFTLKGSRHNKSFCKVCGSALPCTVIKDVLVVPAGCLDTSISIAPTARIFASRKGVWDKDLISVPSFDELPE